MLNLAVVKPFKTTFLGSVAKTNPIDTKPCLNVLANDTFQKSTEVNNNSNLVSFTSNPDLKPAFDKILANFNKPIIPPERLEKWLGQFDEPDRPTALKLLGCIDFHTYPDMFMEVQQLHECLNDQLKKDGFDAKNHTNVDFSKIYNCKSGDVVSYIYRKANKIRTTNFKTIEEIKKNPPKDINDRALVLLDDYIGTGSQFLIEYLACNKENQNLFNQFKKIYFVTLSANENAINKFDLLAEGKSDVVATEHCEQYKNEAFVLNNRDQIFKSLEALNGNKLQLLTLNKEVPFLSDKYEKLSSEDKKEVKSFLEKYNVYKYPFGVGNRQGHTSFFYSAPNTLPDILWNSKIGKAKVKGTDQNWMPLFQRTEDISIYKCADDIPPEYQVF